MDKALKQRLVGASVLIALAVIVLPMLLSGRPDGSMRETSKIELPEQPPELSFETRRFPVGEQAPRNSPQETPLQASPAATQLPAPRPDPDLAGDPAPAQPGPDSRNAVSADTVAQADPAPGDIPDEGSSATDQTGLPLPEAEPEDGTGGSGRYVVQVASLGSVEAANRLAGTLRGIGYDVMIDSVKSDVGTLNRVRVGPFETEQAAGEAVAKLEVQVNGVSPRIVDMQPGQSAQAAQPEDPLVRWVVQVGSFSSAANAEGLVNRLRESGMSAYSETVASANAAIHRVRVGPFLRRDDAIATERRVRESMGLDGVVMSAN